MLTLHPNILENTNGIKEFAILPFKEFIKIQKELQAYEYLKDLRDAKKKEEKIIGYSFENAKKELNI